MGCIFLHSKYQSSSSSARGISDSEETATLNRPYRVSRYAAARSHSWPPPLEAAERQVPGDSVMLFVADAAHDQFALGVAGRRLVLIETSPEAAHILGVHALHLGGCGLGEAGLRLGHAHDLAECQADRHLVRQYAPPPPEDGDGHLEVALQPVARRRQEALTHGERLVLFECVGGHEVVAVLERQLDE